MSREIDAGLADSFITLLIGRGRRSDNVMSAFFPVNRPEKDLNKTAKPKADDRMARPKQPLRYGLESKADF
jgi:hypothetical protein